MNRRSNNSNINKNDEDSEASPLALFKRSMRGLVSADDEKIIIENQLKSKLVRIYLSSSDSDSLNERIYLREKIVPELRELFYRNYGLEFQLIEAERTTAGVNDDESELKLCQKHSLGPYYVSLITDFHYDSIKNELEQLVLHDDAHHRTFCMIREIENLRPVLKTVDEVDSKKHFINLNAADNSVDENSQAELNRLKSKLEAFYSNDENQILKFKVDWKSEFKTISFESNESYFKDLGLKFKQKIVELFEFNLNISSLSSSAFTGLKYNQLRKLDELSNHLKRKRQLIDEYKNEDFSQELAKVKEYILSENTDTPLIIYGDDLIEKSALTAAICENIPIYIPPDSDDTEFRLIFRFSNLTRQTSNVADLLRSIIFQFNEFEEILNYFTSGFHENELRDYLDAIYLDENCRCRAIDRSNAGNLMSAPDKLFYTISYGHDVKYLNKSLLNLFYEFKYVCLRSPIDRRQIWDKEKDEKPKSMKKIFLIDSIDQLIINESDSSEMFRFIVDNIRPLGSSVKLIFTFDKKNMTAFDDVKWIRINSIEIKQPRNLQLKEISRIISSSIKESCTMDEMFRILFEKLDDEFGRSLIRSFVFYMRELNGLASDDEIEDILSLDDHHHNQMKQPTYRIIDVWLKFKHRLSKFIFINNVYDLNDRTSLLAKIHNRDLEKRMHEHYLSDLNQNEISLMLMNIYHYFIGTYRDREKEKSFLSDSSSSVRPQRRGRVLTKDQQLMLKPTKMIGECRLCFNKRKLDIFPYLLARLGEIGCSMDLVESSLKKHVYFNIEFLLAKIVCIDSTFRFLNDLEPLLWKFYSRYEKENKNEKNDNPIEELILLNEYLKKNPEHLLMYVDVLEFHLKESFLTYCIQSKNRSEKSEFHRLFTGGAEESFNFDLNCFCSNEAMLSMDFRKRISRELVIEFNYYTNRIYCPPNDSSRICFNIAGDFYLMDYKRQQLIARYEFSKSDMNILLVCCDLSSSNSDGKSSFRDEKIRLIISMKSEKNEKTINLFEYDLATREATLVSSLNKNNRFLGIYLVYPNFLLHLRQEFEINCLPFTGDNKESYSRPILRCEKKISRIYSNIDNKCLMDSSQKSSTNLLLFVLFADAELQVYKIIEKNDTKNSFAASCELVSTINDFITTKNADEAATQVFFLLDRQTLANAGQSSRSNSRNNLARFCFKLKESNMLNVFELEILQNVDTTATTTTMKCKQAIQSIDLSKISSNHKNVLIYDFNDNLLLFRAGSDLFCLHAETKKLLDLAGHHKGVGRFSSKSRIFLVDHDEAKYTVLKFNDSELRSQHSLMTTKAIVEESFQFKAFVIHRSDIEKDPLKSIFISNNDRLFHFESDSGRILKLLTIDLTRPAPKVELNHTRNLKSLNIILEQQEKQQQIANKQKMLLLFNDSQLIYRDEKSAKVLSFDVRNANDPNEIGRKLDGIDFRGKLCTLTFNRETIVLTFTNSVKSSFIQVYKLDDEQQASMTVRLVHQAPLSSNLMLYFKHAESVLVLRDSSTFSMMNFDQQSMMMNIYLLRRTSGGFVESFGQFGMNEFMPKEETNDQSFFNRPNIPDFYLTNSSFFLLALKKNRIYLIDWIGIQAPKLLFSQLLNIEEDTGQQQSGHQNTFAQILIDEQRKNENNLVIKLGNQSKTNIYYASLSENTNEYKLRMIFNQNVSQMRLKGDTLVVSVYSDTRNTFSQHLISSIQVINLKNAIHAIQTGQVMPTPFLKIPLAESNILSFEISVDQQYLYYKYGQTRLYIQSLIDTKKHSSVGWPILNSGFQLSTSVVFSPKSSILTVISQHNPESTRRNRNRRNLEIKTTTVGSISNYVFLDSQHQNYEKHLETYKYLLKFSITLKISKQQSSKREDDVKKFLKCLNPDGRGSEEFDELTKSQQICDLKEL